MDESLKILVVDSDTQRRVRTSEKLKGLGYDVVSADNIADAVDTFVNETIGVVFADTTSSGIESAALVPQIRTHSVNFVPIVLVVRRGQIPRADAASKGEAESYLTAPYEFDELGIRIAVMLRLKRLSDRREPAPQTRRRTEDDLQIAGEEVVLRLAKAAENRLDSHSRHVERVSQMSALLAKKIGLVPERVEMVRFASMLHDIGKFLIPDHALLRRGSLSPDEFEIAKQHCEAGYLYLSKSDSPVLDLAASIAWTHHERVDGGGYPQGLMGTDIPLEGRIVAIADVFDSLTNTQPYHDAFSIEESLNTMIKGRGTQFDSNLLDLFLDSMDEVKGIIALYPNQEDISEEIYTEEQLCILVVDDEPDAREILSVKLEAEGFSVLTAGDGNEALEVRRNNEVDLVLLDVMMPGMDGFDVCRTMKAETQGQFFPIILVTAKGTSESRVAGFQSQADGYVTKPVDLNALVAQIQALMHTKNSHDKMRDDTKRFEKLSQTDPLTGLFNRRFLMNRMEYEFSRARRYNHNVAVLMLDVDHFKKINDTRGHLAGDFVLKEVANLLKMNGRRVDTVSRYGGEEFIMLLPNTQEEEATALANRIRRVVEQNEFEYGSVPPSSVPPSSVIPREYAASDESLEMGIKVTISIGITCYPKNRAKNEHEFIHQADDALYMAKQGGRNQVVVFSEVNAVVTDER